LEKYATLDSFDPLALTYLFAAYRQPALSDEEKLSALSIEGAAEKDAFKRRDLAARLLPSINARLEATRKERYYKVDVMDPVVSSTYRRARIQRSSGRLDCRAYSTTTSTERHSPRPAWKTEPSAAPVETCSSTAR
jgi:hypothetical protein